MVRMPSVVGSSPSQGNCLFNLYSLSALAPFPLSKCKRIFMYFRNVRGKVWDFCRVLLVCGWSNLMSMLEALVLHTLVKMPNSLKRDPNLTLEEIFFCILPEMQGHKGVRDLG